MMFKVGFYEIETKSIDCVNTSIYRTLAVFGSVKVYKDGKLYGVYKRK